MGQQDRAIDVGAHKGEILEVLINCAPNQQHWAFEPIPWMFETLKASSPNQHVLPYALSNSSGQTEFQIVRDDLAYSGIRKRSYRRKSPHIETVQVQMRTLDEVIPIHESIKLIKIDVEGGEYDVLRGAVNTIRAHHPTLIFEFGKGASEHYGTSPNQMFELLESLNYRVFTLDAFIANETPLTRESWNVHYSQGTEYYFVAQA